MRRKTLLVVICVMTALLLLTGCSKEKKQKGIEGTWVLFEEYDKDGTRVSPDELKEIGISEKYEIKGTKAVYTCEMKGASKPIVFDLDMEVLGDNKYCFKMAGKIVFPADEVILDGDLLTYEVGTVEDNNYMKMVFKRQ